MRELIESIRQMNESTISETRDYTRAELESIIDDANAVMDDLDGHEQVIVQSAIEDIVAAIESDDLETASEFAEDILDIIAGEDFDDEDIIDIDESADSTDLKPGDSIFVGLANKNGTGYSGVLERIEGNKVIFRGIDGRLLQGRLDLAIKQEDTAEAFNPSVKTRMNARKGMPVTENKEYSVAQEDGEWVVKDASGNIVDTATDKLGALQAARDLNNMKQSNRRVVTGKQPRADVEEDYQPGE